MLTPEEAETIAAHATEAGYPLTAADVLAAATIPPGTIEAVVETWERQKREAEMQSWREFHAAWLAANGPCYALVSTDPGRSSASPPPARP